MALHECTLVGNLQKRQMHVIGGSAENGITSIETEDVSYSVDMMDKAIENLRFALAADCNHFRVNSPELASFGPSSPHRLEAARVIRQGKGDILVFGLTCQPESPIL